MRLSSSNRYHASRAAQLAERAHEMRFARVTPSEAALWAAIRGRRLGVQFRRQVPLLGRFICDFVAAEVRLVVEVDGGWHDDRVVPDGRRDAALARAGYRVLRVAAELVLSNLPEAVARVAEAVAEGRVQRR